MISIMGKVKKINLMAQGIQESTETAKSMDLENTSGLMETSSKATSSSMR